MRTQEGVALGGRYRLVRSIAVGGMGEVWEAFDESLARPVAVKALRPEFADDAAQLARFRVEARNSAALSHPNIAPLFDYGEESGTAYLAMELVGGEPLSDILEAEPVLPLSRLLPILSQTARGLHYAHQMGVVHRDVKPGNLLVEATGRVRITDFGVSLAANQTPMTAAGMVMGTAQYLSPEQAIGRPATGVSDLYALGIVAYEALVGHRPFTGGSAVDIAVAQVNDPVPPLPATIDPRLARLVMALLDKNPANRPQSGAELAELLDALVPRTPASGSPVAPDRPAGRRVASSSPAAGAAAPAPAAASAPAPRPAPAAPAARPATPPPAADRPHDRPAGATAGAPPSFAPRGTGLPPTTTQSPPGARPGRPVAMDPATGAPVGPSRRRVPDPASSGYPMSASSGRSAAGRSAGGRTAADRTASGRTAAGQGPARPGPRLRPRWTRIALVVLGLLVVALLGAMAARSARADVSPRAPTVMHIVAERAPIPSSASPVRAEGASDDRGGQL
ncbi:MAG: protein kinase [Cellulomonas sp.]|nr:protein kinase [Cellulomonas sp.]